METGHPFPHDFLLEQLEKVAAQLGIAIRYERLGDEEISVRSGSCKVLNRELIIIDADLNASGRACVLARELSAHDLEDLYILPAVRAYIALQSPLREKNRPQI